MQYSISGWFIFKSLCLTAKDDKYLEQLLDLLLTAEERENIAMRCLIVKALLDKSRTQRQLAKELGVSIAKITRGSNELKRFKKGFLSELLSRMANKAGEN